MTDVLSQMITETLIGWASTSTIGDETLIREMFHLIYRQYNSLGEVIIAIIIFTIKNQKSFQKAQKREL